MAISKVTRKIAIGICALAVLGGCSSAEEPTAAPSPTPIAPDPVTFKAFRADQICTTIKQIKPEDFTDEGWFKGSRSVTVEDSEIVSVGIKVYEHHEFGGKTYLFQGPPAERWEVEAALDNNCPEQVTRLDGILADAKASTATRVAKEAEEDAEEAKREKALEAGTRIMDGSSYVVGDDMDAGTWHTVTKGLITDCYWERTSGSGNIIDNHFGNSTRMTVTVHNGEIFKTEDCGEWEKA